MYKLCGRVFCNYSILSIHFIQLAGCHPLKVSIDMLMIQYWWCCKLILLNRCRFCQTTGLSIWEWLSWWWWYMWYIQWARVLQAHAAWWLSQQRQPTEHFLLIQYWWCCTLQVIQQTKLAHFGPFTWSSMNFLQDWGKNSVLSLSKLSVWILVIHGVITL